MQRARAVIAPSKGHVVRSALGTSSSHVLPARRFAIIATRSSSRPVQRSLLSSPSSSLLPLRFHVSLRHFHASRHIQQSAAAPEAVEEKDAPSVMDGTDPDQVARAILSHLRDASPQGDAAKRNARLRSLLRDLKQGEGVGRALLAVSRDLGLRRTGRLLPLLYSSQEKGSINRLTYLLLTLAHGHVQQGQHHPQSFLTVLATHPIVCVRCVSCVRVSCVVSDVAGNNRGQGAKGPDQGSRTAHERCRGDVGGRGAFPRLAVRRRTDPKLTFARAIVSPRRAGRRQAAPGHPALALLLTGRGQGVPVRQH